jgi:hypothetical protein
MLFHLGYINLRTLAARRDVSSKTLDDLPATLPDQFVRDIELFHGELIQRNVPLVLSTFLVKYRRDQSRSVQIKNADVSFYYMPWMNIDDLLKGIGMYNDAIARYARSHHVPIAEDADSIPADSRHFVDCIHLNDAGCTLMAQRILRCLEENHLIESLRERGKAATGSRLPVSG